MSASDAAPLPRLGEVFFDVRGDSRTMRLSWYANTDVAVFSIWQGGRCTGTFRLPMDELGRMTEILQRGPEGRSAHKAGERGRGPNVGYEGDHGADHTVVHSAGARDSADFGGAYGPGPDDYRPAEHGSDEFWQGEYGDSEDGGYPTTGRHGSPRHEPADYGRRDYQQPATEYWQDPDHFQADRTGQRYVPERGYGQQRFEPPYVRPGHDSSEPGFMDEREYRQPADPASRSRHSAGRHGGGQPL